MTISIFIVNFNTSDFIELSLYALSKLTVNSYKVKIIDNGSKPSDYQKLQQICSRYNNIEIIKNNTTLRGSIAHGTALNELCQQIDTPYFSILDADALWLKKDWDKILINQLNENIKVIGTQAPLGSIKPEDFPLMFAIIFETKTFNKLNIDFRPQNIALGQDTGFDIREKYQKAKIGGKIIEMKHTENYKSGPLNKVICAEYYLDKNYLQIFASHFGRGSSTLPVKYMSKNRNSLYNIPVVSTLLAKYKMLNEKNKWINLCYQIINQQ
ncbi:MAG: glycosyltransferase family A protein [Candidatus Shapirobacteria bacterium]